MAKRMERGKRVQSDEPWKGRYGRQKGKTVHLAGQKELSQLYFEKKGRQAEIKKRPNRKKYIYLVTQKQSRYWPKKKKLKRRST